MGEWEDLRQTVSGFMGSLRVALQVRRKRKEDAKLATDTQMAGGQRGREAGWREGKEPQKGSCRRGYGNHCGYS